MRTTLDRTQYDATIRRQLSILLRPEAIPPQYPKDRLTAMRELTYRGAAYVGLPDRPWTAAELDVLIDTAEVSEQFTEAAAAAAMLDMPLVQYYFEHGDPGLYPSGDGCRTIDLERSGAIGPTMIYFPPVEVTFDE